jgi:hypothetical protein
VRSGRILGQKRDALGREGHCLVLEAAHRDDGHRIAATARVHLEDIAVRARQCIGRLFVFDGPVGAFSEKRWLTG